MSIKGSFLSWALTSASAQCLYYYASPVNFYSKRMYKNSSKKILKTPLTSYPTYAIISLLMRQEPPREKGLIRYDEGNANDY